MLEEKIGEKMKYKNWELFYNKDGRKCYWNADLKLEIAMGKSWSFDYKKYGYGVGVYHSPHGKYNNKGVKVKKRIWFKTKKEATEYMANYMKRVK